MKHLNWILPLTLGIIGIVIWYLLLGYEIVSPFVLPPPHVILQEMWLKREELMVGGGRTFQAAIIGFLAAVTGGFVIAFILASNRYIKATIYPHILILQMTPIVVMTPIMGLWLGYGLNSITAITFLISFFPVVANTTLGLISTDKGMIDLFKMGGATKVQEITLLRIPYALPYFLTGVKIAGTLAPIGAITGDFLLGNSAKAGLGFLVLTYRARSETPAIFALALLACLLGFVFVAAVNTLHYYLLKNWHESTAKPES